MKQSLKSFIVIAWFIVAILVGIGLWVSERHVVPIMMYHSVNLEEKKEVNTIHPENFRKHLEYLKTNGYNVISLKELFEAIKNDHSLPAKSVVITFDDGYADNFLYAYNELKWYGFPAIIFLTVDEIGKEGYLNWKQIKEMEKNRIDFGSHTRTHAYLPNLSEEEIMDEILNSKKIMEKNLGHTVDFLAYPNGGFSEKIKSLVRKAGYQAACATNRGYDRLNNDRFELKRIRFGDEDNSNVILFVKLSGFYNLFRKSKAPY